MKNFTQYLCGYRHDFAKYTEKVATLKSLCKFCFLICPLISFAGKPGFSSASAHTTNPTDSIAITETLRTNLYLLQPDGSTILADGVFTIYNNLYHDSVTLEDATKFTNPLENLGILRYGKTLAVERRPIIQANDTLFYKFWKAKKRAYQIELIANMLTNEGLQAFFVDSYLNTSIPVSLGDTTKINFSVNGDAASSASDRFKITFKPKPPYVPTPVIFTSINASQQGEKIAVRWQVQNETDVAKYEVEKSINGTEFSLVNTALVTTTGKISGDYNWFDDNKVSGSNFYRIKSINRNGSSNVTSVVKVITSKTGASFVVYPNPVKGNTINLQIMDQVAGIYQLRLINSSGQTVYTNKLSVSNNSTLKSLKVGTALKKGIYQLEIKKTDRSTEVKAVLVQ